MAENLIVATLFAAAMFATLHERLFGTMNYSRANTRARMPTLLGLNVAVVNASHSFVTAFVVALRHSLHQMPASRSPHKQVLGCTYIKEL